MLDQMKFFNACNPSKTLKIENREDQQYYIDFSSVRGGNVIKRLNRTITQSNESTCQLFTGHIGCGKSTELFRLKYELEKQGFYVVYIESDDDLDMSDVDISDILLAITRQVSESLEKVNIKLKPSYFINLFNEVADTLQTPGVPEFEFSLPIGIGKVTAKTKGSHRLRSQLRQYLEPRTSNIIDAINEQILERAKEELSHKGFKGLVVIFDTLDRLDISPKASGRSQPEYLFIDRGEQLKKLKCHLVYTIPLVLMFSNEFITLTHRFGIKPEILPMVILRSREGNYNLEGMNLLRQMVLARAFPSLSPAERLSLINEVFDSEETLDRLCQISGGHIRNLFVILYDCLRENDPPINRDCLEKVIRIYRDDLVSVISDSQREMLLRVIQQRDNFTGEYEYSILLRSLFLLEYQDNEGRWFEINPAIAESKKFKL